jgi:hypothetical protein
MEKIHSVCIEIQEHVQRGIEAAYESVFSQSPNDVSIALGFVCPCRRASKDGHLMIMDETYKDNARCSQKITPLDARQILWFKLPCEAMNASALGKIVEEESIYYVNPTLDSSDTPSGKGIRDDSTSSRFINEVVESCDIVIENKPVTGRYLSAAQKVEYSE